MLNAAEKLILGIATGVTAIYRYFAPQRRRMEEAFTAEGTERHLAKQSEKSDATIFATVPQVGNINTAAGKLLFIKRRYKAIIH
jgi:hypothetical protein